MGYRVLITLMICVAIGCWCAFIPLHRVAAQEPGQVHQDDDKPLINLAAKGVLDLPGLVQWASEIEKFQLMLDNDAFRQAQNRVVFISQVNVDRNTLMLLVQEVLRANGFALVESQVPGWKRVANLSNVAPFSPVVDPNDMQQLDYQYVSAVFQLKHLSAETAKAQLTGFLPGAPAAAAAGDNIRAIANSRILVVTDQVINIRRIERLVGQIDIPREGDQVEFYKVKNLEAQELKSLLDTILGQIGSSDVNPLQADASAEAENAVMSLDPSALAARISADLRTNRLIVVGRPPAIRAVLSLIEQLDVPLDLVLNSYRLEHVAAKKIDEMVRQSLRGVSTESLERIYQATIDEQTNQLIVSARPEIHEQIVRLRSQLDQPDSVQQQNKMRFYTLKNVKASEILHTLQSVERQVQPRSANNRTPMTGIVARDSFRPQGPSLLNEFTEGPPSYPPRPPVDNRSMGVRQAGGWQDEFQSVVGSSMAEELSRLLDDPDGMRRLIPGDAKITVDENTNTLIIVAEPEVQALYAQLIERLDRRRPQVMIEAHV